MTRAVPRSLLLTAAVLLLLRIAVGVHEARNPRAPASRVNWREPEQAQREAAESERPLLQVYSADWCRPCKKMAREVFANEDAGALVNELFIPVRIEDGLEGDGLSDEGAAALRERFDVEAFPTLLVVRDGEVLGRSVGYEGRDETLEFLRGSVAAR